MSYVSYDVRCQSVEPPYVTEPEPLARCRYCGGDIYAEDVADGDVCEYDGYLFHNDYDCVMGFVKQFRKVNLWDCQC